MREEVKQELVKCLKIARVAGFHHAADYIERNFQITDQEEPEYRIDKVAWVKWYRGMMKCTLKEAAEEGKRRYQ